MAERQSSDQPHSHDTRTHSPQPPTKDDMIGYVMALEAALLPCLPAQELQAIDRSPHPSHQIDVERHARDFMEAAKKLQLYFIGLQREDQSTNQRRNLAKGYCDDGGRTEDKD
ncbi:mediator of RNA polymerase II transcription subunit 28 [Helianthus annuus]|uniref:mediator of RNA polymerase II transcription subunit 28 n=1 Tax=Helianthus annuus TaxID=4232 RepID=UPI000B8F2C2E|nr:mediator of RNA polymerase II transcription subunit 28 [Helianthus annuus]